MDRILREYRRVVDQHAATLPTEVLKYIGMLERLASDNVALPPDIHALNDQEMRAIYVLTQYAARFCGGGEDTIGALLYTGAFLRLAPAIDRSSPEFINDPAQVMLASRQEAERRAVNLANFIDEFQSNQG